MGTEPNHQKDKRKFTERQKSGVGLALLKWALCMKTKKLSEDGLKIYALIFDKGDEVTEGLLKFARSIEISAGHFTAIGAFESSTLGFFDPERKDYLKIEFNEQMEVLSLVGDIALKESKPEVHAHVVLGRRDGTAHGGHLIRARVWPTLELIVTESPEHLRRVIDDETGLALIDPER
jgi:uncharacterized protein